MMQPMDDVREQLVRWWRPLAAAAVGVALLIASALAASSRDEAIDDRLDAASAAAASGAGALLTRELTVDEVAEPLDAGDFRDLYVLLRAEVLTEPSVARVRIWSSDGVILFSTGDRAEIGTAPGVGRGLAEALQGERSSRTTSERFTPATAGLEAVPTRMWETWVPLRTADRTDAQGAVEVDRYYEVVVAGAGSDAGRFATIARWLALASLVLAAVLAVATLRSRGGALDLSEDHVPTIAVDDVSSPDMPADEAQIALAEVERERDVSIARASEAAERERLARDRLETLAPLEQRVEVAERRALDAERRLEEISERVEGASNGESSVGTDAPEPPIDEPQESSASAARQAAELRERLARTAARKKPGAGR